MKPWIAALLILLAGRAMAQEHQHGHSPYAGLERREIKALSEQQIADLRAGRGMGLALAAELNGYPGPLHVLELADQLKLTVDQKQRVQQLFEAMKVEAIAAGEKLIASEKDLDRAFAAHNMTAAHLTMLMTRIGEQQGAVRAAHLKYHLATDEVLSAEQKQRYADLRGYR
jgi:Spy/CpxP family protein refolding chaperone